MRIVLQLIRKVSTRQKRAFKRIKSFKFAILQVLPYPLSEVTDAAYCFSQLETVAAVCRFCHVIDCRLLHGIFAFHQANILLKTI